MAMDTGGPRSGQLARFHPKEGFPSLLHLFREARNNTLAVWTSRTFKEKVFLYRTPVVDALFLNDPEGLRHVLTQPDLYPKARVQGEILKPALGESVLTTHGDSWAWQRRAMQPAFHAKRIEPLVPMMAAVSRERFARWREGGGEIRLDIHDEMMGLTLDILCNTLFTGLTFDRSALGRDISDFLDIYVRPDFLTLLGVPGWVPRVKWWQARPVLRDMRAIMEQILKARLADPAPPDDFLTLLLEAHDRETGRTLSHQNVKDNLSTFLAAGHETTAVALTWSAYLLSEFPEAAEKLRAEADQHLDDGEITADKVAKLIHTRRFVEEAMRLYPPVPLVDRQAAGPDRVAGHDVRKGTIILISPYVLHRHEALWEDPERFDPDRFSPEAVKARHRYTYMPFNLGPRSCIGMGFAMTEATLVLALLVQNFDVLALKRGADIKPVALVSLRPEGGMPVTLTPR